MNLPPYYKDGEETYGLLHAYRTKTHVIVYFNGNMGNTIGDVRQVFDTFYGRGLFDLTRKVATKESGWPDYQWYMEIPIKDWERVSANTLIPVSDIINGS